MKRIIKIFLMTMIIFIISSCNNKTNGNEYIFIGYYDNNSNGMGRTHSQEFGTRIKAKNELKETQEIEVSYGYTGPHVIDEILIIKPDSDREKYSNLNQNLRLDLYRIVYKKNKEGYDKSETIIYSTNNVLKNFFDFFYADDNTFIDTINKNELFTEEITEATIGYFYTLTPTDDEYIQLFDGIKENGELKPGPLYGEVIEGTTLCKKYICPIKTGIKCELQDGKIRFLEPEKRPTNISE